MVTTRIVATLITQWMDEALWPRLRLSLKAARLLDCADCCVFTMPSLTDGADTGKSTAARSAARPIYPFLNKLGTQDCHELEAKFATEATLCEAHQTPREYYRD